MGERSHCDYLHSQIPDFELLLACASKIFLFSLGVIELRVLLFKTIVLWFLTKNSLFSLFRKY
jgi:hypothetical protein